jgi:hypothetical protein
VELRHGQTLVAVGRLAHLDTPDVPAASFLEAEDAARQSPYNDQTRHILPGCFVCGPARAVGDGLRVFVGPLPTSSGRNVEALAASWVPGFDLTATDGRVSSEFLWAVLDCPSGFACLGARHLGMSGSEPMLLGRMAAQINQRPRSGDRTVVVAWPTSRDGRKLFANSALLGADGEVLAVAQTTWLVVDRQVLLGQPRNRPRGPPFDPTQTQNAEESQSFRSQNRYCTKPLPR